MSTTFDAALDVKKISPHPANPRRSATADPELVASIKAQGLIQPLIVAPSGDGFVLIAGHRRLDGLKKARLKTAPAVIREDLTTDAQQVEAAVVENVHRVDLTPIEEAEAFEQLRGLKWTQKQIADRTGRPIATVRDRLKLLTLSKKTITSVHTGQLTIGDALAIASFDDKTQAKLSKAAGTPHFQHALQNEKSKRSNQRKLDAVLEKLDGVPPIELTKSQSVWNHPSLSLTAIYPGSGTDDVPETVAGLQKDHPDCLGYIIEGADTYYAGRVHLRCINPEAHAEDDESDFSDVDVEADRRRLEAQKAREEEVQALAAARAVRVNTIMGQVGAGTKLDAKFVDVARVLLPQMLAGLSGREVLIYQAAAGIPEPERWDFGWGIGNASVMAIETFVAHVAEISIAKPGTLARYLIAALLAQLEDGSVGVPPRQYGNPLAPELARPYYQLLEALGFEPSAVDVANIELTVDVDEAEDDEAAS